MTYVETGFECVIGIRAGRQLVENERPCNQHLKADGALEPPVPPVIQPKVCKLSNNVITHRIS